MKKRLIATLISTTLILSTLAGCGASTADTSSTTEVTATVEDGAEAAEDVLATPEPTPEETATSEPTPTPVVELADDEVIPASLEAWDKAKHYLYNQVISGEDYTEDEVRHVAYDRDANAIAVIGPSYKPYYSNGMLYMDNGSEQKLYSLCDGGKYFDTTELFDAELIQEQFTDYFATQLTRVNTGQSTNFVYGADTYHVAHDWTSDNMNPDDYYLIESYNNHILGAGPEFIVAYNAYYINKATLLPEYYTTQLYYNYVDEETGEDITIVKDDDGNIIEYNGDPHVTFVGEFIYFDDEAAQSGDDYDTYIYMTTVPTDDQILTGDDLAAYVTEYEEANPDLFTEAE